MLKRSRFSNPYLPYLLILPQLLITVVFFFYPAFEALVQAFLLTDPFGQTSQFVWFDNFEFLFDSKEYWKSFGVTFIFSVSTCVVSLSSGLLLAVLTNRVINFRRWVRSLFIWPYAIAPAIAGVLWLYLFHPSYGVLGHLLTQYLKVNWNPTLNGAHAMILVVLAASWKQISYNYVFFLSGLQGVPKSIIEAAAIDGAGPVRRFWYIVFPMLTPTFFFLVVMNFVYAFFDTFGIIHTTTEGGPGGATTTLVYKVYKDGFVGLDLGGSATQSVVLMIMTIVLTSIQFRFLEKKVQYAK